MALICMIEGESGTGKSATMRGFKPGECTIINVSKKPLPFRNQLTTYNTDDYAQIVGYLKMADTPAIVIDDSQYLMVNAFMRRSSEKGYDKFTEIAHNHWALIDWIVNKLPADKIVYFMTHIDRDQNGNEKAKTVGKMIDQYITLEGLFTIVLKTHVEDGKYTLRTHNSGFDTVKSPIGMFEQDEIDNDLALVDRTIREYYGIKETEK